MTVKLFQFNPFLPRAAKSGHFVILLCLMPDDFTHQRGTLDGKGLSYIGKIKNRIFG